MNGFFCKFAQFTKLIYQHMKKRHKLIMIITFVIIAVFEILIWINAYVDMKYIVEPCGNVFLTKHMYMCQFSVVLHIAKFRISRIPDYTSYNDQSTQINSITRQNQSYEQL